MIRMNILIADDVKLIMEDLVREVQEIFPAAVIDGVISALHAVELSKHTAYDVALLDIDMPDLDGLTLAKQLIASNPSINIIFVTGYKEYALGAHEMFCSAFLIKPVGHRALKKAFENLRKPVLNLPRDFSESHYSGNAIIGERIKLCREQRNISRQELADLMCVSRQTVFRWEQGERLPDIMTLLTLVRILGTTVTDLLEKEK